MLSQNGVELLTDRLEKGQTPFGKKKAAFVARLAESKVQPDAAPLEMTNQRDRLGDEIDPQSSNQNDLSVELKTTPR